MTNARRLTLPVGYFVLMRSVTLKRKTVLSKVNLVKNPVQEDLSQTFSVNFLIIL